MKPIFVIFAALIALSAYSETRTCTFTGEMFENIPVSIQWKSPVKVGTAFKFSAPMSASIKTISIQEEDSSRLRKVSECVEHLGRDSEVETLFRCIGEIYGASAESKALMTIPYDYLLALTVSQNFNLDLNQVASIKRYTITEMSQFGQGGISEYFDASGNSVGLILNLTSFVVPLNCEAQI